MSVDFVVQLRRSAPFYLGVFVVVLVLSLIDRWSTHTVVSVVAGLAVFVVWAAMAVFAAVDIFSYYWRGSDLFLLMAPWSKTAMVACKVAIHAVWFFLVFLANWIPGASKLGLGHRVWSISMGVAGARLLGILVFLLLVAALVRLVKSSNNFVLSICLVIVCYVAITTACSWWVLEWCGGLGAKGGTWAIGFGSDGPAVSQYVNILPIAITDSANRVGVLVGSIGVNCVVLAFSVILWFVLSLRRENFYYRG